MTLNAAGSTGNRGVALQLGTDYKVGNSLCVFSEKQFSSGDEQNGLSPVYGLDHTPAKEWTLSALFQNSNSDDGEATGCGARAFLAD